RGLFVQSLADAVAGVLAHDRESVALDVLLDRRADVAEAFAGLGRADAAPHALLRHIEQPLSLGRDRAHRIGDTGIAEPALQPRPDVDADDVAFFERRVVRNTMADHVIWCDADCRGEATIAFVGRDGAATADELLGDAVELARGHAWADMWPQCLERLGN